MSIILTAMVNIKSFGWKLFGPSSQRYPSCFTVVTFPPTLGRDSVTKNLLPTAAECFVAKACNNAPSNTPGAPYVLDVIHPSNCHDLQRWEARYPSCATRTRKTLTPKISAATNRDGSLAKVRQSANPLQILFIFNFSIVHDSELPSRLA